MLTLETVIDINKYGQELIPSDSLANEFLKLDLVAKRSYLDDLVTLILQSKPSNEDIIPAIIASNMKSSFTPCVLLTKGVASHNLYNIVKLPENELQKALLLLLALFKMSYQRRFQVEKNNLSKWWYWDLSDDKNIELLKEVIQKGGYL